MKFDNYLNNGVVFHVEQGNVITDANRQVVYIAHSTSPKRTVMQTALGSLCKLLFKKAGVKVKNWESPILIGANIPARLEIQYKAEDGDVVTTKAFAMPVTLTLAQLVLDIVNWVDSFANNRLDPIVPIS